MLLRIHARSLIATVLAALTIGCGDSTPTTPSGPVPEITRVDPGEVAPGPGTQMLSISGQGFTTGLTVLVTQPNGTRTEVSGDAIQGLQSVLFQVSVPFDAAGDYKLAVRLLSGTESNEITISARTAGGSAPRIDAVTPGAVQASPAATVVVLTGANFTTGSTASMTTPDGVTLPAGAITLISPTSIQISIVFATAGNYGLSVTSAQGQASNTATVTAF